MFSENVSSLQCVKEFVGFFLGFFCSKFPFIILYRSVVVNAAVLYTSALNSLSTENVSNLSKV